MTDKIPSLEDYQAPWEKAGEEVDADKAKKLIHSLLGQLENATTAKNDAAALLTAAEEGRATAELRVKALEKRIDAGAENESDELKTVREEKKALQEQIDTFDVKKHPEFIRMQVAVAKGLDEFEAAHIQGSNVEELNASADGFVARRPKAADVDDESGDGGEQEEENPYFDGIGLSRAPVTSKAKPNGHQPGKSDDVFSDAEVAAVLNGGNSIRI